MTEQRSVNCPKRKRGYTYATAEVAIRETRERFERTNQKLFLYYCRDVPCRASGYIHQTVQRPNKQNARLNRKLLNIYAEHERAGTAAPRKRSAASLRARKVRRNIALLTWQDDGGALHPRELED